ncbi:hypothetical protein DM02DRAFT_237754 [Periconia macrospinosa]|uniref:Uncharacterized protein n=1 Tax=Periconia macrospinosa TaxID=97972 RepID=A0A2V1EBR2_9PLEO|nr:hypothetical protein DM02DRAFT_237754 [Periconia macrospinosa]
MEHVHSMPWQLSWCWRARGESPPIRPRASWGCRRPWAPAAMERSHVDERGHLAGAGGGGVIGATIFVRGRINPAPSANPSFLGRSLVCLPALPVHISLTLPAHLAHPAHRQPETRCWPLRLSERHFQSPAIQRLESQKKRDGSCGHLGSSYGTTARSTTYNSFTTTTAVSSIIIHTVTTAAAVEIISPSFTHIFAHPPPCCNYTSNSNNNNNNNNRCCCFPASPDATAHVLHSPQLPHLHITEMVETLPDTCQPNTSRRIFTENQLRINGFNTYG